ncbi:MAG: MotA/TolQ/ExbB proton channel family protein [Elusimicrobia bacterium]|jgi:biopolymer transport protein ExbB/TolQ|nr:MotA/TolQ/ExbB proton channel family protein [Elusimicrobiota bacterium]
MNITLKQLIIAGGPVLFALMALSIYSIALIWERWTVYKKTFSGMDDLIHKAHAMIKSGELRQLSELASKTKTPAGDIVHKVISHYGSALEKRELAEKAVEWHVARLGRSLTAIATIGSISPFVGLFGTVIGVIRAFKDLSMYAGAGPSVVAMGISEALVNTAAGLFVAIPAIIAYNYFAHKANEFSSEMNWLTEQVIERSTHREYSGIA